jgi:hypothetical protein
MAAGPFGGFEYRRGGDAQIWIAGGLAITSFISGIRSLPDDFHHEVSFSCSVSHASAAIFLDEIKRPRQPTRPCDRPLSTPARMAFSLPTSWSPTCRPTGALGLQVRPPAMTIAMVSGFESPGIPAQTDPVGTIQHPLTTIEVGRT